MKIAVYGSYYNANKDEIYFSIFFKRIVELKIECIIEENLYQSLKKSFHQYTFETFSTTHTLDKSFDFIFTFGGDGTILRAATFVMDSGIPIVGINTGRLGFLASINKIDCARILDLIHAGNYKIGEKNLLSVETAPEAQHINTSTIALNEVAVSRKNTDSMITITTHLNGAYLTSYWADGLIIATPTGSTAYSLSCGGPIISPSSSSLVLTPIAPHNLNARPLIISDETTIEISVEGREDQFFLSLDSRKISLSNQLKIKIKKADYAIKFAHPNDQSFFDTLRKKLLWGQDVRN